ncbi:GGDEF domain-containing protein [Colwellia sp. Bg11-28]|uniref:GGDEF domain-containing protein n=1 Tax=Colwellia sp. Bg11-28 TaxID=2058305 RepID=UPI000C349144|nr:GGDEF domain-containing protein [Colwellia sp. Bg11-28]PKH88856.1 GGDEF domain-containing protein [Colwellia sp. Bg11-28]
MNNNATFYIDSKVLRKSKWTLFIFFSIYILATNEASAQDIQQKRDITQQLTVIDNVNLAKKLELADNNRHANPLLFKKIMNELTLEKLRLTAIQQSLLDYLEGYSLAYSGEHDEAERKLKIILNSNASDLIKFRARYTLINISAINERWAEGLKFISTNNELISSVENQEHIQTNILATIIFYTQIKQYQLALQSIDKLASKKTTPQIQCFLMQFNIEAKFHLKQLSLRDVKINEALELCHEAKNKIGASLIRIYQAKLNLQIKKPNIALAILLPQIENIKSTLFPMLIAGMNNTLSEAYYQTGDIHNSKSYALKALKINKNNSAVKRGMDSYKLLYQIAKSEQDFNLALKYHEKYAELDKAYLEGEKAKHLAFQLAEHKSLEQKSKIKLLNKKNSLLLSDQALSKAKVVNIQLMISILMVTLALLVLWGARLLKAHKRVRELAEYDPLTGIYNRGHFTHVTNSALKYCKNAQQDLSVIMFDLDHFKKVNDSFGHACGDWALKETIKVCQRIGRKNDIFARLGGEEFCLVLTGCTIDVAMLRAEACRAAIEEIITEESGNDFSITASFGVTDIKRSGFTLDKLLADADMAAYASKNAGRNRVTLFEVPYTAKANKLDDSWNYN